MRQRKHSIYLFIFLIMYGKDILVRGLFSSQRQEFSRFPRVMKRQIFGSKCQRFFVPEITAVTSKSSQVSLFPASVIAPLKPSCNKSYHCINASGRFSVKRNHFPSTLTPFHERSTHFSSNVTLTYICSRCLLNSSAHQRAHTPPYPRPTDCHIDEPKFSVIFIHLSIHLGACLPTKYL